MKSLRQHRTEIVVQMRSQIFRQIVHKFRRHTDVCQEICVQDAGKYEGQMCHKAVRRSLCSVALRVDNQLRLWYDVLKRGEEYEKN